MRDNRDLKTLRPGRPRVLDFVKLSSARARASVILAGKRDSRFSENVVVAGTSSQMLEVLSFCERERN